MKNKRKKKTVFPETPRTEFGRFTDPEELLFDPDTPQTDPAGESFFREPPAEPETDADRFL